MHASLYFAREYNLLCVRFCCAFYGQHLGIQFYFKLRAIFQFDVILQAWVNAFIVYRRIESVIFIYFALIYPRVMFIFKQLPVTYKIEFGHGLCEPILNLTFWACKNKQAEPKCKCVGLVGPGNKQACPSCFICK